MKTFKQFIAEGGNVKVGEASAKPIVISIESRNEVAKDIEDSLIQLSRAFYRDYGIHLFGLAEKSLHNLTAYSGSSKHLFDKNISADEFVKHKPSMGDIDVKVPKEILGKLQEYLIQGRRFGNYTVLGIKSGGGELHALVQHHRGEVHQIDFEGTEYIEGEPHSFAQFAHSANWEDIKSGFKGAHKSILLGAAGQDKYKYSINYGLGSREDKNNPNWETNTHKIAEKMFGKGTNEKHLHSFKGIVHLVKHRIPKEQHQNIFNRFSEATGKMKNVDSKKAIEYLKKELNL